MDAFSKKDFRRSLLIGGAVGGAALLSRSGAARADAAFTNFSFPGTGSPASRNTPDRIADNFNVKEWGAKGDGVTDDTVAIQSVINAAAALNPSGGTIFFPPGKYPVNQSLYINHPGSYLFLGSGRNATLIKGTIAGFIISQVGQVGGGSGVTISITGAVSGTGGVIRLTISGTSFSGTPANPAQAFLTQNVPYTISGIVGTGAVAALNGTSPRFTIFDGTHIEVIGSTFGGSYSSGGTIAGGTQAAVMCVEHMHINNPNQAASCGAIYYGYISSLSYINDCVLEGYVGADVASSRYLGGSFGVAVYNCWFNGAATVGQADQSHTGYAGLPSGSIGLILGEGIVVGCRVQLFNIGFAMSGVACNVIGCSVERSNYGVFVGQSDSVINDSLAGGSIIGLQTERCNVSIYVNNANGLKCSGNVLTCSNGTPDPSNLAASNSLSWAANVVTVTTANNHNLGPNGTKFSVGLNGVPGQYLAQSNAGNVTVTVTGPTTFTYPLTVNPSPAANPFSGGKWLYGPQSGIQVNSAQNCTFDANNTANSFFPSGGVFGSMDLSGGGSHSNNVIMSSDISSGFILPISANKAAWKIIQSSHFGASLAINYGDLPGQTSNQPGPFEDQEYAIVDGATGKCADGTCTTLGTNVTGGGGSLHLKVRWNAATSHWTLCGA